MFRFRLVNSIVPSATNYAVASLCRFRSTGFGIDRFVPYLCSRGGAGNSCDRPCAPCSFIQNCKTCTTTHPCRLFFEMLVVTTPIESVSTATREVAVTSIRQHLGATTCLNSVGSRMVIYFFLSVIGGCSSSCSSFSSLFQFSSLFPITAPRPACCPVCLLCACLRWFPEVRRQYFVPAAVFEQYSTVLVIVWWSTPRANHLSGSQARLVLILS